MSSITPFQATDLFALSRVNLDPLTENFPPAFYLQYLTEWPELFLMSRQAVAAGSAGDVGDGSALAGYMMAKTEGKGTEWHSHITAVTVGPLYRRLGLALDLCRQVETTLRSKAVDAYFVDLFVKVTNTTALAMYRGLGYRPFRRVVGYYGKEYPSRKVKDDSVDAFDMRLQLPRDVDGVETRDKGEDYLVYPADVRF